MELSQSFCFNHKRFLLLILQYPKIDILFYCLIVLYLYKNNKISLSLFDVCTYLSCRNAALSSNKLNR
jgi:hypothetical protein